MSAGILMFIFVLGSFSPELPAGPAPLLHEHTHGLYSGAWQATAEWDEAAEEEYGRWVERLGAAREKKSFRIAWALRHKEVNPLYTPEDRYLRFETDCGELPYVLRAYFAYKTGRPFQFVANRGKRYRLGNKPTEFMDWTQFDDFDSLLSMILSRVTTATYRMDPRLEETDTYTLDVTPDSIRPGVVYYDPNGHVLQVYRVDHESGKVYMMDAHPDGTLTLKVFSAKLGIGSGKAAGGFKAWRRYRVEVVDVLAGSFRIVRTLNRDCAFYSATVQYRRRYEVLGFTLTYHEWVPLRVSRYGNAVRWIEEASAFAEDLSADVRSGIEATIATITAGMREQSRK